MYTWINNYNFNNPVNFNLPTNFISTDLNLLTIVGFAGIPYNRFKIIEN